MTTDRYRCYVCNADPQDGCQAIGGEVAECPRPARCNHDYQEADQGPTWTLRRCTKCDDEIRDFND